MAKRNDESGKPGSVTGLAALRLAVRRRISRASIPLASVRASLMRALLANVVINLDSAWIILQPQINDFGFQDQSII
jgi:hypothetical protein